MSDLINKQGLAKPGDDTFEEIAPMWDVNACTPVVGAVLAMEMQGLLHLPPEETPVGKYFQNYASKVATAYKTPDFAKQMEVNLRGMIAARQRHDTMMFLVELRRSQELVEAEILPPGF